MAKPHDRAVADQSGQFVMVLPRLPSGTYDLTLRARQPDGKQITSKQSVAVVLEPQATDRPVVALMTPDKPTVVLSQPACGKAWRPAPWSWRRSRSTQAANSMSAARHARMRR